MSLEDHYSYGTKQKGRKREGKEQSGGKDTACPPGGEWFCPLVLGFPAY